ncbi:hypothetical protein MMC07_005108 [Pseudocyphellaria aurata]|nr:hypothetical protein [Pseudocyphellaria aurata]
MDPVTKQKVGGSADISLPTTSYSSSKASVDVGGHPSNTSPRSSKTESASWKPDVYVKSFVPRAFTAINNSPAILVNSVEVETIRFREYTKSFAGDFLLPEIAAQPYPPMYSGMNLVSVEKLSTDNYRDHMLDCLLLDHEKQSGEIRLYDLYGVTLEVSDVSQEIFKLHVPGIREGAPSIAYGDRVMLRQLRLDPQTSIPLGMENFFHLGGESDGRIPAPGFTGYQINAVVIAVAKGVEDVFLRINGVLPEQLVFNVCFLVQERHFQSMERAVGSTSDKLAVKYSSQSQLSHWLRCMLFPSDADGIWQKNPPSGKFRQTWFDQNLNYEQKKAIDAIQSKNYGTTPFLIHGPPGTGKTKTICESVKQLCNDPNFDGAILLCAPSDPAADQLALRLKAQFGPSEMFRLNDYSRTFAEVPQELLSNCYIDSSIFSLPPFPKLLRYKIVITTCQAANILVQTRTTNQDLALLEKNLESMLHPRLGRESPSKGGTSLHWAALLVDEAAQATEPELLIPLSVVSPPLSYNSVCPIFVLAGDQYQLSPRTHDKRSTLHISLFERLSSLPLYASHPLSRKNSNRTTSFKPALHPAFANLTRNYRSHPAILAVSSALFYNNTLIPEATGIDSLQSWPAWQGKCWPVLFACNAGVDTCEDVQTTSRGGWYNLREAKKAIAYAVYLISSGLIATQSDICIIAPFDTQVRLLRTIARANQLWGVNIGPVEAFQGLESRFVIFCTTRTRTRFIKHDNERGMGIIGQPKKFNVGLTRAKEGLIVLGNPCVLGQDECWGAFLGFCWRNGLWEKEKFEGEGRLRDFVEDKVDGMVNEWAPPQENQAEESRRGLERALIHREDERGAQTKGSRAARRFMGESVEDVMWRMGLEAEAWVLGI